MIATLFMIRRTPRGQRAGPIAMAVALLGAFLMNTATWQPRTFEDWRILAISDMLLIVGLSFALYAGACLRHCFGLAPEARGLVTHGAYALVRHPLYLGEFVATTGLLLPVLSPITASIFAAFAVFQVLRMRMEERILGAAFPEYAAYRRRTPALIPWPR
jgi:protein-S-isoprenylcysteine O-methyltransferase Ste14